LVIYKAAKDSLYNIKFQKPPLQRIQPYHTASTSATTNVQPLNTSRNHKDLLISGTILTSQNKQTKMHNISTEIRKFLIIIII